MTLIFLPLLSKRLNYKYTLPQPIGVTAETKGVGGRN